MADQSLPPGTQLLLSVVTLIHEWYRLVTDADPDQQSISPRDRAPLYWPQFMLVCSHMVGNSIIGIINEYPL